LALLGPPAMSAFAPLSGAKRTSAASGRDDAAHRSRTAMITKRRTRRVDPASGRPSPSGCNTTRLVGPKMLGPHLLQVCQKKLPAPACSVPTCDCVKFFTSGSRQPREDRWSTRWMEGFNGSVIDRRRSLAVDQLLEARR